jgi:hypothetical protein
VDKKTFSEVRERLLEAGKTIEKLDPSIRGAALDLLKPYILGAGPSPQSNPAEPSVPDSRGSDQSQLIHTHGDGKPHENVNLIAAIWFSEYGSNAFSTDYIREKASSTGLTIPARPEMTLKTAKDSGRSLYAPNGRGLFKPTVVGEAFLKTKYGVRKGTGTPASSK